MTIAIHLVFILYFGAKTARYVRVGMHGECNCDVAYAQSRLFLHANDQPRLATSWHASRYEVLRRRRLHRGARRTRSASRLASGTSASTGYGRYGWQFDHRAIARGTFWAVPIPCIWTSRPALLSVHAGSFPSRLRSWEQRPHTTAHSRHSAVDSSDAEPRKPPHWCSRELHRPVSGAPW